MKRIIIYVFIILFLFVLSLNSFSSNNEKTRDDGLNKKRKEITNKLRQIYYLGGDHLGYSRKISSYLFDKYKIKADKQPIKQYIAKRKNFSRRSRRSIDYYSMITGGLAIRESLQLDTIRPSLEAEYTIPLSTLTGPTVKSHPFKKMLEGREYKAYPLAKISPEDFYYFHFSNMGKALDIFDYLNDVGGAVYQKFTPKSIDYAIKRKILTQLAIVENKSARKFYDLVIDEMAVVGSDPFIRTGSDVSFICKLKRSKIFFLKIDNYRNSFIKKYNARKTDLKILGREAELLKSRNRVIHSYLVKLDKDTVLISNSKKAVEIIIKTYNKKHSAVGDAYDFKYMRSIYKAGDKNEDAFLYLSDLFIRKLVGPEARIKEARRMREAQRLANLEVFGLYYYQLYGKKPKNIDDLQKELTGEEILMFKGLSFDEKSFAALSERYGKLGYFLPNIDYDIKSISEEEQKEYKSFLGRYNNYWRDYFDPIGIRILKKNDETKIETCILPLINNSIYNSITEIFGGKGIKFSTSNYSIPGEIFNLTAKINSKFLDQVNKEMYSSYLLYDGKLKRPVSFSEIFRDEIKIGMYDAQPMVDFDASRFLSLISGSSIRFEEAAIAMAAWSFFHPVSITIPVKDNKNIARYTGRLENMFFRKLRFGRSELDRYSIKYKNENINVSKILLFGVMKLRFFSTIHNGHYIITSTEEYIYKIIDSLDREKEKSGGFFASSKKLNENAGNIMTKFKPAQLKLEKNMYILNMLESDREASLKNYGTFKLFKDIFGNKNIDKASYDSFGFMLNCPSGGTYKLEDGIVKNSVYGNGRNKVLDKNSLLEKDTFKRFFSTEEIKVNLEFTPEGIKTIMHIK